MKTLVTVLLLIQFVQAILIFSLHRNLMGARDNIRVVIQAMHSQQQSTALLAEWIMEFENTIEETEEAAEKGF